jgi:RNA polymerase sigma-70 factor (ECF subfamily)
MSDLSPEEVTSLLMAWNKGDDCALERLIPLVYRDLRKIASAHLRKERPEHTIQTTALINEAYLRLAPNQKTIWQNRNHFLAVASHVMRHILVDYARERGRKKRGGDILHIPLDDVNAGSQDIPRQIVAVHEALERLNATDPRKARVVELRFFGGLSVEQVASALSLSETTVARDWSDAKAWLRQELRG